MASDKQKTLPVFRDIFGITENLLSNEQFGILMRAYFNYSESGAEYSGDDPSIKIAFGFMANQLDRYQDAIEAKSKQNSINGKRGGRPSIQKAEESKEKQNKANETEIKQNKANETEDKQKKHHIISDHIISDHINSDIDNTSSEDDVFEEFWKAYPKKVGKQAAMKAFKKVNVDVATLINAIDKQKETRQWKENNGQFIPNPSTWLNQCRWEDETEPEQSKPDSIFEMDQHQQMEHYLEGWPF